MSFDPRWSGTPGWFIRQSNRRARRRQMAGKWQ